MCKDVALFTNKSPTHAVDVLGDGTKLLTDCKDDVNLPTAFGIIH